MTDITYYNVLFIVENNLQNQAYRGKLYPKGYKTK